MCGGWENRIGRTWSVVRQMRFRLHFGHQTSQNFVPLLTVPPFTLLFLPSRMPAYFRLAGSWPKCRPERTTTSFFGLSPLALAFATFHIFVRAIVLLNCSAALCVTVVLAVLVLCTSYNDRVKARTTRLQHHSGHEVSRVVVAYCHCRPSFSSCCS